MNFYSNEKGLFYMENQNAKEIYSSMDNVWPDNNQWYDYTHRTIIEFIENNLSHKLHTQNIYLNAGSGGSVYNLAGKCYHVDIAENLIHSLPNHYVASIENLPFEDSMFDATICVGSVINYCSALESIAELARTLKTGGYLIIEFERSNTAELWFNKEYGKQITMQKYEYLNHIHTLWLYREQYMRRLLKENGLNVIKYKRFHSLSALVNKITQKEDLSGMYSKYDDILSPFSRYMAHNIIMLCIKDK